MSISALLDKFAALERPLCISACSAPSEPLVDTSGGNPKGGVTSVNPGHWRTEWSPEAQCRWLTHVAAIATSKPYVHSVCWHELFDGPKGAFWRADGLITSAGQPKPSMFRLAEIRQGLKEKKSPLTLPPLPTLHMA